MKEDDKREAAENSIRLGHLSALLKVDEDGVFAQLKISDALNMSVNSAREHKKTYLLVELGIVLSGPVLGLDKQGVLLDLLGGGHGCRLRVVVVDVNGLSCKVTTGLQQSTYALMTRVCFSTSAA